MPKLAQAVHRTPFVLAFTLFTLLLCALEYIFCLFTSRTAAALLPLLPTALLLALLRWTGSPTFLPPAITAAAAVRLFTSLVPHRDRIHLWGTFLLDAVAAYLYLARQALTGEFPTDKILFIILAVLTLSALQQLLTGQNRAPYPFFYYALLGCILMFLPMSPKPLDWSPVVEAGQRLAHAVVNTANEVAYYFSDAFGGDTYTTGYSSLDVNGGAVDNSNRTQLILTMAEKPYYTYTNLETAQKMRVRRTLYLAGGRGANKQQLVNFLNLLHMGGADRAYAKLFSKTSEVDVRYALIDTYDEIAPSGAFLLYTGQNIAIESGTSTSEHRKGYKLSARYLDIDYGSPYLIGLFRNAGNTLNSSESVLTYEEACEYAHTLYGIELDNILTRKEYEELTDTPEVKNTPEVTDTTGSSGRMAELAATLTANATNDYDKSKLIEAYLRQFTYDTSASGGSNPQSDMTTSEGMADIADRFLFEAGRGYCVHYTSAMVMLLRLSGIPARAVSGYRYAFPLEEQADYEVSGSCAHVWPEAYLKGVGWVPFEPTVIYRTASEFTWHKEAAGGATDSPDQTTPDLPQPPENATSEVPGSDDEATSGVSEPGLVARILRIALPVALSVLLLLAILIAGTGAISRIRYNHASPNKKLQMDVEMIKKAIRRQASEDFTDRGLLTDYLDQAPEALRPDIKKVFDIYYRVLYGNSNATAQENEFARQIRERLSS